MYKKRLKHSMVVGVIAGVICILYLFINMTVDFIKSSQYETINHFNDISVCSAFDEYIVEEELVDEYISDIDFTNSYVNKLDYNGKVFILFAYEFKNIDDARRYYSNVEGSSVDGNIDYHGTTGLFSSDLTVRYNNNVYRIETGSTNDYIEIMKYLNSVFTIRIRE